MTPEDLKSAILRGADVIDARKTWSVDRSKYLNASEALSCVRKQWFSKHEPSTAAEDWGFARRGTHGEKYVVEMLRASGLELMFAGEDQQSVADEELMISATPDGVLFNASGAHTALEIKTDGEALIIRPVQLTKRERVRESTRRMMSVHDETLQKLAK